MVFALVEERTGLLAPEHVELHPHFALAVLHGPGRLAAEDSLHLRQPFQLAHLHVVPFHHRARLERVSDDGRQHLLALSVAGTKVCMTSTSPKRSTTKPRQQIRSPFTSLSALSPGKIRSRSSSAEAIRSAKNPSSTGTSSR